MRKAPASPFWDPEKALLVTAARVARGNGRAVRRRPRNPDEAAALALAALRVWNSGTFVQRIGDKTYRLLDR